MRSLSPEQVQQYLAAFDRTDLGAAIATAIGSGCRRGELLALRWSDVDLDQGTLRVARSLERVTIRTAKRARYELRFKEPKTKRSRRTIALPPFAIERLRRHRLEQAERFFSAGATPRRQHPALRARRLAVESQHFRPDVRADRSRREAPEGAAARSAPFVRVAAPGRRADLKTVSTGARALDHQLSPPTCTRT